MFESGVCVAKMHDVEMCEVWCRGTCAGASRAEEERERKEEKETCTEGGDAEDRER
jgi:hypothetical protein